MKALSILLAAYISFLSVHPVMVAIKPVSLIPSEKKCTTICCEEMQKVIEEKALCRETDDCYSNGICNPNFSCVCGLYCFCCVVENSSAPFTPSQNSAQLNAPPDQSLVSNYHSKCFRPPEVI